MINNRDYIRKRFIIFLVLTTLIANFMYLSSCSFPSTFNVPTDLTRITPPENIDYSGTFYTGFANQGLLLVQYVSNSKIKLEIIEGSNSIIYNLNNKGEPEHFPLQFGNGCYTAKILRNLNSNVYVTEDSYSFDVTIYNANSVYLNSIQNINWDFSMAPINDVVNIIANYSSNKEETMEYSCVRAIYNYIIKNIKYDQNKLECINQYYLPCINDIYKNNKGICYDYASLFAAMVRSVSIPCKLVKGYAEYAPDVYHAWNEVYLDGQWITVDTTLDASYYQLLWITPVMEKDTSGYDKVYEY